jgi:hypothetical protein
MILDIVKHSLMITGFVAVMMLVIEYLNVLLVFVMMFAKGVIPFSVLLASWIVNMVEQFEPKQAKALLQAGNLLHVEQSGTPITPLSSAWPDRCRRIPAGPCASGRRYTVCMAR